ncbi:phage portal protein [Pseudonocardia hispaniensis]|uniref:Phage portal protein n=1 Tax=Pseudonocardia hispaniensis TaxID=904933 RepID=A0ABW1IWT8_9PSEU
MAFVVSAGQLATVDKPPLPAPYALALSDTVVQDYATIWRTQPQVRTVVSFLARNIAQLGLHVFRRISDVDRERLTDHPLARMLATPNPTTTRYRMFDALVQDLGIYDRAFWLKVKTTGASPAAVVRLDPRKVTLLGDNPFQADGYRYRGAKGRRDFPADQIVHFHGYSPEDHRDGYSPVETLRRILAEEYQAAVWREQLWRNGARVSGYLKRPVEAPQWSKDARARFRRQWQAQYTGDGPQVGGTPILEDGMEFTPAAVTPEQAQYLEARKLTREEVAAAYHIPLPMVQILDHATFSNIREQHKQLYQDCLGPWLQMIAEELQLQLVPEFADTGRVYVEFNMHEKLRGSFEEQATQLQMAIGGPFMTRNEGRARLNLPQIDGGDDLIVPLNVLTGGQASPQDSAPPPKRQRVRRVKARAPKTYLSRAEKRLTRFFERQGRAVAGRLGAEKARRKADPPQIDDVFDDERWNTELAAEMYLLNLEVATATAHSTLQALGLDPDDYDEERTLAFLSANAERVAGGVNGATRNAVEDALGDDDPLAAIKHLFEVYATARAAQVALSQVTSMSGFGTTEAARQRSPHATKTWRVRSSNPRPSHARMDGETVLLDQRFSNRAMWPGDSDLDDDERAGCTCDIEVEVP